MGDSFLSQDAIDALISQIGDSGGSSGGGALDTGLGGLGDLGAFAAAAAAASDDKPASSHASEKAKDVKVFDFSRASKFSKDQIRTMQMIHETFARLFAGTLSAKIRALTKIKVVSVEELTFEDFISNVQNPSIITVFSMAPMEGNAVLNISPQIGFPLMDRLLGGAGDESGSEALELTDIEINIMEHVIHDALNFMKEAWSNVINLTPKLEMLESNPYFVQVVPPGEMIVLINFEAEIGEKTGLINIALPYIMLEGVLGKLSIQEWFATFRRTVSPAVTKKVEQRLLKTNVNIVAELGTTCISLKDFLNLNVGDILQIRRKVTDEIDIYVGDKLKFKGRPGQIGKHIAVQTTTVVKEREDV